MKIEDVIALTQAGFSKSEILAMTQQVTPQVQQVTPQTQPVQQAQNDALLNAITNLTNVIQAGNVAATGLQMKQNQPETADQIMQRMMDIMN